MLDGTDVSDVSAMEVTSQSGFRQFSSSLDSPGGFWTHVWDCSNCITFCSNACCCTLCCFSISEAHALNQTGTSSSDVRDNPLVGLDAISVNIDTQQIFLFCVCVCVFFFVFEGVANGGGI